MKIIFQLLLLAGSLSFLLFGLRQTSASVNRIVSQKLQSWFINLSTTPFRAFGVGFLSTVLLQSSSAVISVLMGIVNYGGLSLRNAMGGVIGANIASTLTSYIIVIAFYKLNVTTAALLLGAISLPLLFTKKEQHREVSNILSGAILFLIGFFLMQELLISENNLKIFSFLNNQFTTFSTSSLFLFFFLGFLLSAALQISSVAIIFILLLALQQHIPIPSAGVAILGANLGATLHTNLFANVLNQEAKGAARFHFLFNLIGVLWAFPLLLHILNITQTVTGNGVVGLALFHTLFNLINGAILFCFLKPLSRFVMAAAKVDLPKAEKLSRYSFAWDLSSEKFELELKRIIKDVGHASDLVHLILLKTLKTIGSKKYDAEVIQIELMQDELKFVEWYQSISQELSSLAIQAHTKKEAARIFSTVRIVEELNIAVDNAMKIVTVLKRTQTLKYDFHKKAFYELEDCAGFVLDFMRYVSDYLSGKLPVFDLSIAEKMEENIDNQRDFLQERGSSKIEKGAEIRAELAYIDIVRKLEHIGDNCLNIAVECKKLT